MFFVRTPKIQKLIPGAFTRAFSCCTANNLFYHGTIAEDCEFLEKKNYLQQPKLPTMSGYSMKLLSGSSNPELSKEIARYLNLDLAKMSITKFADNEIGIQVLENVRGSDVFVIQSCSTPVNDNYFELFLIVDALKRASAKRFTPLIF